MRLLALLSILLLCATIPLCTLVKVTSPAYGSEPKPVTPPKPVGPAKTGAVNPLDAAPTASKMMWDFEHADGKLPRVPWQSAGGWTSEDSENPKSASKAGTGIDYSLDDAVKGGGKYSMKIDYTINDSGFREISYAIWGKAPDLSQYNALRFWLKPDGSNRIFAIGFKDSQAHFWEKGVKMTGTEPMIVTLPFAEMTRSPWGNQSPAVIHTNAVPELMVWIRAGYGGPGKGTVHLDNIEAVNLPGVPLPENTPLPKLTAGDGSPATPCYTIPASAAVDADPAKWAPMKPCVMDKADEYASIDGQSWGGKDDLSARFWLGSDGENLRLCVAVTDQKHSQPYDAGNMWKGDSVQFMVYSHGKRFILGISLSDAGQPQYCQWSQQDGVVPAAQVKIAAKRVGNETRCEIAVPWGALAGYKPAEKSPLAFALLVNENDGAGRKGCLEWVRGFGADKHTNTALPVEWK